MRVVEAVLVGDGVDEGGWEVGAEVAPPHPNWTLLICQVVVVDEKPEKTIAVTALAFAPLNELNGTVMV